VPDRVFKDLDVISMYGAFYLIMVPLCVFMVIFDELMREKSDKLRLGMQVLGTQDNAYWTSWIITASMMNAIMTLEMIAIGRWFQFDVFVKTPVWVFFFLMFNTTQAYISIAIFFSTIVTEKSQAFTVNFCVILCSMVMNIVLSEPTIIKKVFFNLDMPFWVYLATTCFYFNPCF